MVKMQCTICTKPTQCHRHVQAQNGFILIVVNYSYLKIYMYHTVQMRWNKLQKSFFLALRKYQTLSGCDWSSYSKKNVFRLYHFYWYRLYFVHHIKHPNRTQVWLNWITRYFISFHFVYFHFQQYKSKYIIYIVHSITIKLNIVNITSP